MQYMRLSSRRKAQGPFVLLSEALRTMDPRAQTDHTRAPGLQLCSVDCCWAGRRGGHTTGSTRRDAEKKFQGPGRLVHTLAIHGRRACYHSRGGGRIERACGVACTNPGRIVAAASAGTAGSS